MEETTRPKPIVLAILDGFGYNPQTTSSPWQQSEHPIFSKIETDYPFTTLQASALAVGLPWGEPGNSEVGHLTMGAGKIIYSHLPRIISAIQDNTFFENEVLLAGINNVVKNKSDLHLIGLFSSGSVHAYADHLYAFLDLTKTHEGINVYLHIFTDGRDAAPEEGAGFIKKLEDKLVEKYPNVKIASIIGRRFAMDRDENWDRIEKAYNLLTKGAGEPYEKASEYIQKNYTDGRTDEFLNPGFLKESQRIKEKDSVIFFNYREDSARELTKAFTIDGFDKFPRTKINELTFITMTEYESGLPVLVAFPPLGIPEPLAKIIAEAGLSQLHIAETEKYAHVTYFFNGGREKPFEKEDRILVPSPRTPHYDETPEMSAQTITDTVLEAISKEKYDFILINFANADMVGHTGNFQACIRSVEILDRCIGQLMPKILEKDGVLIITADHGNMEEKIYQFSGKKRTNHTTNPVPFYLIGNRWKRQEPAPENMIKEQYKKTQGTLVDIAPTILQIMELKIPEEMNGKSLLNKLK